MRSSTKACCKVRNCGGDRCALCGEGRYVGGMGIRSFFV